MNRCCLILVYGILLLGFRSEAILPSWANETDYASLLDFKKQTNQVLISWNDLTHFCNWVGVACNSSSGRIVSLNLESQGLSGVIPPSVGNLTFLTTIKLGGNSFHGEIPQELGRLVNLETLNMSFNNLDGNIPANLTYCTKLRVIDLMQNKLVGYIPDQLSTLTELSILTLALNRLTGKIPSWIGNFSSLLGLSLALNSFQGELPDEMGNLPKFGFFQVYGNNLSGTIPSSIYNISSLYYFAAASNRFHGQLPQNVGLTLPNLEIFAAGDNSLTGTIPESLSNASKLIVIDFSMNGLSGSIPPNLGNLKSLTRLYLGSNRLGNGEIGELGLINELANCTGLRILGIENNNFSGELPSSISNLSSQLLSLTMGSNFFYGQIPDGIKNLVNLSLLGFEDNNLSGNVPQVIGNLKNLEGLELNDNKFSGVIPTSIGNLTKLTRLFLEENGFEGSIPLSLGNCRNLQNMNLSTNHLNGTIPKEVIGLTSLSIALVMSRNFLTGSLPSEVGKLVNVKELDLSENKLSGQIPSTIGSCIGLETLRFKSNILEGKVPQSMESLRGLKELDLSHNNLSGQIPGFLISFLSLEHLDLSYNNIEGEVSKEGLFSNSSAFSVNGNDKLCGGVPQLLLPQCSDKKPRNRKPHFTVIIIAVTVSVIAVLAVLSSVIFWVKKNKREVALLSSHGDWQADISYSDLMRSTNGLSEENLIGSGSFGSVYKGILPNTGKIAAIKVFNLQQLGGLRSFVDECNALRYIRHRNLVKVITACSSIDNQGHEFKALVFDFMSNGNLDQWLHPRDEENEFRHLSLKQRLNIAIDIASALDYLHNCCDKQIVHCDLKPSNVLLDQDMTAHVGDFGLTRFLSDSSNNQTVSLKGSIGYIPPEYGMGSEISVSGDVYSFGILLLEMFTGKRPIDDTFENNSSIQEFVANALPQFVMKIADPTMFVGKESKDYGDDDDEDDEEGECESDMEEASICKQYGDKNSSNCSSTVEVCLVSIMSIGISCSSASPRNRISMDEVVNKLSSIRDSFVGFSNRGKVSRRGSTISALSLSS